jgi:hypothetical protein
MAERNYAAAFQTIERGSNGLGKRLSFAPLRVPWQNTSDETRRIAKNKNQALPTGAATAINQLLGLAAVIAALGALASANTAEKIMLGRTLARRRCRSGAET